MSLFADLKVCLRFHDNCGKLIKLSNNHQTAQLTSPGGDCYFLCGHDGMVISRDPMLTDMLYQVNETFSVCFSVSLSLSLCCCLSFSPALCQTCIQSCGTVVLRFAGPPCQVAARATRFRRV